MVADQTFTISQNSVFEEVQKTTGYIGAKLADDGTAYDRIYAKPENKEILQRFWDEAASGATDVFKPFIKTLTVDTSYIAVITPKSDFITSLTTSMNKSLFSYFVSYIVAKWNKFTNKQEIDTYMADAASALKDVKRKLYYGKKPTVPTTL